MKSIALLTLIGALALGAPARSADAPSAAAKPNFVIFIADDLSWHDVACFGGPTDAKTPHLDRLASEGVKLTGFYSSAAVCAPTRQALLTGLYPVRNGAYPNHSMVREGTRSLPYHLKSLGYRTACFGKKHFGPASAFPFDRMVGMVADGAGKAKAGGGGGEDADDGDPNTAALAEFITARKEQPFCAYIASHEPHAPWTKGDKSVYDPAKLKIPPYLVDTPEMRGALRDYYAEVTYLDREVGAVLEALEKTDQTANTLFLFVSEQGSGVPHGKWTVYNPGVRVAAIARWPGHIKPGSENAALVQYVDVLPTLIAAAGADPTKIDTGCPDATGDHGFDGRSMLDVLLGKTGKHREFVFAQHTTRGIINGSEAYATRAVCDGRWKLILNLHADALFRNIISDGSLIQSWIKKGKAGDAFAAEQAARYTKRPAVELYDLQADPWELVDVAGKAENAETLGKLRAQLDAWMKQQGDEGDKTEREAKDRQGKKRQK